MEIDPSYIQFEVHQLSEKFEYDDHDPFGEQRAIRELLQRVARNPFAAIKITPHATFNPQQLELPHPDELRHLDYAATQRWLTRVVQHRELADDELQRLFMLSPDYSLL